MSFYVIAYNRATFLCILVRRYKSKDAKSKVHNEMARVWDAASMKNW